MWEFSRSPLTPSVIQYSKATRQPKSRYSRATELIISCENRIRFGRPEAAPETEIRKCFAAETEGRLSPNLVGRHRSSPRRPRRLCFHGFRYLNVLSMYV